MALQQFEAAKSGPEVYADFMAWLDELQETRVSQTWSTWAGMNRAAPT
jgi:hypothetical protein